MVIRLVATDLDGTFWDANMVVPDAHVDAVRELTSRGVTVLAATSRRPRVVRANLAAAGLALPAVLVDGAIGIDFRTEQRFHRAVFTPALAAATLAAFRAAGLEPCVYVDDPDIDIVISDNPATCPAHLAYIADVARVEKLDTAVTARPVFAFAVLGRPRDRLETATHRLAEHRVQFVLYAEPSYGDYGLIVNPPGVSKWSGIDAVAVAVRGGTANVLAVADHFIDPPHEHGWPTLVNLIEQA